MEATAEIRMDDPKRFGKLRDLVKEDLSDRKDWKTRADRNRTQRYATKATKKPLYEGAPNVAEPLIDDLIRELKTAEVTILWQSAKLAQFVGIDAAGVSGASSAERVFDFHLRASRRTRGRIAQIIDDKLCFGFGVAKRIETPGRNGLTIPDFIKVSPFSVVVPTATDEMAEAERVCHIMRYTKGEYWRAAKRERWDDVAARAVEAKMTEKSGGSSYGSLSQLEDDEGGETRARWRDGKLTESRATVPLWEIYYRTEDGGRRVCLISPDLPEQPLYDRPWIHTAVRFTVPQPTAFGTVDIEILETNPPEKPWPFVQFRNEDADGYYNVRGVPEIVETDQKEASAYRTARAVAMDFAGKPFLSGSKKGTNPFKFRAGDYLDGQSIVWADSPVQNLVYQQEYARNLSARRVGSPQGSMSSADQTRDKKTATEVQAQQRISSGMSADAVDRFAEPFSELFTQMWEEMSRSARNNGGKTGLTATETLGLEVWQAEYCISAGVSGRTANQWQMLMSLQAIQPLVSAFPGIAQFVKAGPLGQWLFNLVDVELAKKVVTDGSSMGAPIEQVVAGLGREVGALNAYVQKVSQAEAQEPVASAATAPAGGANV